jgi:hypothetical protein
MRGEGGGGGQGGEMTQTMYAHVNNKKFFKNQKTGCRIFLFV